MNDVLQFDDFAQDAAVVREAVIAGGFTTETGPDGALYTGISQFPVPHWQARIEHWLERPITPGISCFRLNLAGELPHSWVHSDGLCASHASVLYLNPPEQCQGGTAFWEHKTLGIDRMPITSDLAFDTMITKEWKKRDVWQQVRMVSMCWNRFITYSTRLFHSRFPFEAFGQGPQDGRLIWICFYDVEGAI